MLKNIPHPQYSDVAILKKLSEDFPDHKIEFTSVGVNRVVLKVDETPLKNKWNYTQLQRNLDEEIKNIVCEVCSTEIQLHLQGIPYEWNLSEDPQVLAKEK
jgi:hypothetical protein